MIKNKILSEFSDQIKTLFIIETDEYIELDMINIKKEFRNKGYASLVLKRLCDYSDETNKPILLTPAPPEDEKGISYNRLIDFYSKYGFVPNTGSIRDYSLPSCSYKREPNS